MKIKEMSYDDWCKRPKNCDGVSTEYRVQNRQSYWIYKGPEKTYYDTHISNTYYRISSKRDAALEEVHKKLQEHLNASSAGV